MDEQRVRFQVPINKDASDYGVDMTELCLLAKGGKISFDMYPALGHCTITCATADFNVEVE